MAYICKLVTQFPFKILCSINFGPGYGTILTSDVKATFSDKLGTVGGTFGIFVGISFLGIYEIVAELLKEFHRRILRKVIKRPRKTKC